MIEASHNGLNENRRRFSKQVVVEANDPLPQRNIAGYIALVRDVYALHPVLPDVKAARQKTVG